MSQQVKKSGDTIKKLFKAPFKINSYAMLGERLFFSKNCKCPAPQLFILGLPRSGTTLIYQYIVHRLNVSYFTYGVGKFPCAPCVTTFIQYKLHGQYQSGFGSSYGRDSGASAVAPREAGGWWCRFFDINNYMGFDDVTEENIFKLQNTIACVQNIFGGRPFVNKNVKHLLRMEAIEEIFPNSKFLIVDRAISDVAISILRGRYNNLPNPNQWWSVRPTDYEKLKDLSIEEQVVNQCVSLKNKLEKDLSRLPPERIIRIHYEDFCENPEEIIQKIKSCINATETGNQKRSFFKISHSHPKKPRRRKNN